MKLRLLSTLCLPLLLVGTALADDTELTAQTPPANSIWLENLNLSLALTKMGVARAGHSYYNQPINLSGVIYTHGVGISGESEMTIELNGGATEFQAQVGVDDEVKKMGNVSFTVVVDGRTAFESGPIHGGDPSQFVRVDLKGARTLVLKVDNVGLADYGNNADWAGAFIRLVPNKAMPAMTGPPQTVSFPAILPSDPKPAINGPTLLGASPGKPFFYRIPATGSGILTFAAATLPPGLKLDAKSGVIAGQMAQEGTFPIHVTVSNTAGKAQKTLSLRCAPDALALTPPMGWSAYELFGDSTSDAKVREAAQWLVKSGLVAHGYRTILLGDAWQGKRDAKGALQPNARFPNMKALGDYLHSLGLQFGIHSAATEHTAVGAPGSAGYETQDAAQFAAWGVDYLTYEWAPSADDVHPVPVLEDSVNSTAAMEAAFTKMKEALRKTNRDIVFSISIPSSEMSSYNNRIDVATLAKKVGAQVWGERNGLYDNWKAMSNFISLGLNSLVARSPVLASASLQPRMTLPQLRSMMGQVTPATSGTVVAGGVVTGQTAPVPVAPQVSVTSNGTTTTVVIGGGANGGTIEMGGGATVAPGAAVPGAPQGSVSGVVQLGGGTTSSAPATPVAPAVSIAPGVGVTGGVVGQLLPTSPTLPGVIPQPVVPPKPYIPPPLAGPGFWNYPGSLMAGRMGYPDLHLSRLTPGEQMYQMSMWSLYSAPLILSSDIARLDPNLLSPATTAVLTNEEVLSINQDALGRSPFSLNVPYPCLGRAKPLSDSRIAVGLFNSTDLPRKLRVKWASLGLEGAQTVRDVWAHRDMGEFKDGFDALIPAHGVVLIKVGTAKSQVAP